MQASYLLFLDFKGLKPEGLNTSSLPNNFNNINKV